MKTENNKIIAEFMGWKSFNQFSMIAPKSEEDCWAFEDMKFHSDWNWLMEVVEKIESLGYWVEILGGVHNVCLIGLTNNIESFITLDNESKIESVYNACVEFIKWDNENSAKNN